MLLFPWCCAAPGGVLHLTTAEAVVVVVTGVVVVVVVEATGVRSATCQALRPGAMAAICLPPSEADDVR